MGRIEFYKNCFHFQYFKCTLTLQWCETLAFKIEYTRQRRDDLFEWKWIRIGLQGFIDRYWQKRGESDGMKIQPEVERQLAVEKSRQHR